MQSYCCHVDIFAVALLKLRPYFSNTFKFLYLLPADFFKKYHLVILSTRSLAIKYLMIRIEKLCNEKCNGCLLQYHYFPLLSCYCLVYVDFFLKKKLMQSKLGMKIFTKSFYITKMFLHTMFLEKL